MRTGRALRQLPLVVEQILIVAVVPLRRLGGPSALQPAADLIAAFAAAKAARPSEALLSNLRALWLGTFVMFLGSTMCFAERVATSN